MANIKAEPPPKPDTFNGDLGKLPPALAHLKDKKIWVCWCWYWNGKKWTKPPRRVDDLGRNASSSDPTTWGSHAQAVKQVNAGKADGIGVALQGCDVGGVDLDHCCDVETSEEIAAWAEDIVNNPAPTLQWIDMSNWDNEPVPEREWAILNRVPLRQVGLVSGEGGAGKSIIELTKNVAHVTGRDWFGSIPAVGPAIYVGAEDDETEIHIRLAAIAKHYGVTFKELIDGGLHPLCLLGQDATLCAATGKGGKVEVTGLYRQLYERHQAQEHQHRHAKPRLCRQRDRPGAGLCLRHAYAGACPGCGRLGHGAEPSELAGHCVGVWSLRLDRLAGGVPIPAIPQRR
jgi:hypothetical protein